MSATERPALKGPSGAVRVIAVEGDDVRQRRDRLATEEPLEVRAGGPGQEAVRIAVTMRTPGHDFELAAGFLHTEGLVHDIAEIASIRYCVDVAAEQAHNVVTVDLRAPFDPAQLQRNFYATSSCGVCGKAAIDQLSVACAPLEAGPVVGRELITSLPDLLRERQRVFSDTGGLHAAGLFDATGALQLVREDVGRHNAMDKLVGERFLDGATPLSDHVCLVSGRASFELVQKAAVAGIPVLCAVSAPSSLAVETARELGVTLVAFLRGARFNIYTHPARIALDASR